MEQGSPSARGQGRPRLRRGIAPTSPNWARHGALSRVGHAFPNPTVPINLENIRVRMCLKVGTVLEQARMPISNSLADRFVLTLSRHRPRRRVVPVWVPKQNDPTLIRKHSMPSGIGISCRAVVVNHFLPPECSPVHQQWAQKHPLWKRLPAASSVRSSQLKMSPAKSELLGGPNVSSAAEK